MRLYPWDPSTASVGHGGVRYEPGPDGGFDLPEEVASYLHGFHDGGHPMWENAIERQNRLIAEEAARRADPTTLLDAVEQLVKAAQATRPAPEVKAEPVKAEAPKTVPKAEPAAKAAEPASK